MLKIRLRRMGAKKAPFYRIVVADSRAPRDGAFVEEIGYYNPLTDPEQVVVDGVKADEAGEETTIELSVAKDDMGKVIGKQGRIAKAIRTVVRAASVKSEKKYRVDIL